MELNSMGELSQIFSPQLSVFTAQYGAVATIGLLVLMLWTLYWKARGMWRAAHQESKVWFIIFLLINTLGILEIVYLYIITKTKKAIAKPQPAPEPETKPAEPSS